MRRGVVFSALSAPALVFAGVTLWAQSEASGWTPADGELSLPIRVGLALDSWTIRVLPFAVLALVITWPLVVLAIVAVTGSLSPRNTTTRHDVFLWWCASAIAFIVLLVTGGAFHLLRPDGDPPVALLASVAWAAIVAFWVSVAAVYAVQQKRYLAHETTWHPKWWLAALVAVSCFGAFVLPLLVVVALRKSESTHAAG